MSRGFHGGGSRTKAVASDGETTPITRPVAFVDVDDRRPSPCGWRFKGGRLRLLESEPKVWIFHLPLASASPSILDVGFVSVVDGRGTGMDCWGREKSSVFDHSGGDAF
jgi:hypothetical protein